MDRLDFFDLKETADGTRLADADVSLGKRF